MNRSKATVSGEGAALHQGDIETIECIDPAVRFRGRLHRRATSQRVSVELRFPNPLGASACVGAQEPNSNIVDVKARALAAVDDSQLNTERFTSDDARILAQDLVKICTPRRSFIRCGHGREQLFEVNVLRENPSKLERKGVPQSQRVEPTREPDRKASLPDAKINGRSVDGGKASRSGDNTMSVARRRKGFAS
jgi:hypothetical protein